MFTHMHFNVGFVYPLSFGFIPAICKGEHLDFAQGDLNCRIVSWKSGIFWHHTFSVEKVCVSFKLFVINYFSKKYMKENALLNCRVIFFY
jgi:hypothetical protein